MTDVLSSLADTLTEIDNEERSVRLIGHALHQAFCRDPEFRDALRPLLEFLGRKSFASLATRSLHFQDVFNQHLVSAFHAARTVELLHETALEYRDDHYQLGALRMVEHSLGPSVVFSLNCARNILVMDKVLAAIGNAPEQEVMSIFSNRFPRLREARNALAHEDERAFGKVGNSLYSGPNLHEGLQFRSQSGSSIFGLKDKTFQDFDIEFDSKAILSLISDLKILFGVA